MKHLFIDSCCSISFYVLFCTVASAGHVTGNGGSAVVCYDRGYKITSVELFDFYEARLQYNIQISMDETITDPVLLAEHTVKKLGSLDPERTSKYVEQIRHFYENANLVPNAKLERVFDSEGRIIPTGCEIEQLAVQRRPEFSHDRYFTVNKDLWDRLATRDKAGLILHEIIYREAISYGQKSSVRARYFNSLISSHELEKITPDGYIDLLYKLGFLASQNFKQIVPQMKGHYHDGKLYIDEILKKVCADQPVGSLVSVKDSSSSVNWGVCLGHYGPPDKPFFSQYYLRNLAVTSVYLGVFTDEVDGVLDTTVIGLFETAKELVPFCSSTSFSQSTLRVGFARGPVDKMNPSQIQSLQKGQGVCYDFFLDDYRDFTKGTLVLDERIQKVVLKKVF